MHDAGMLAVSRLYENLENFAFCPAGREMYLYGEPAYPLRIHLQKCTYLMNQWVLYERQCNGSLQTLSIIFGL